MTDDHAAAKGVRFHGHGLGEVNVLRAEVRSFLRDAVANGEFEPAIDTWIGSFDAAFSARLGGRGWLGMTWPTRYGGGDRSGLERFVVVEELLAAGAPVAAHWFAERQTGPALLRYGTETQRQTYLPEIAAGRCFFAIGMSEPDSGSDLASVRTRAVPAGDGWRITGTKVWTSQAHRAHHLVVLARTDRETARPHDGLSQFIVDLDAPGVTVRPIPTMGGEHHFNEVALDEVAVPREGLIGVEGEGWSQVMSELVHERSGPERFLSLYPLVSLLVTVCRETGDDVAQPVGELVAELAALRAMSVDVAVALQEGGKPEVEAAIVKDMGTEFEQRLVAVCRDLADQGATAVPARVRALLALAQLRAPSFTLRGGTNEILRGIIARRVLA